MLYRYTVETRGFTSLPAWRFDSTHSSDEAAIEYWTAFFGDSPSCFPAGCYQLVMFCGDRLVAELFLQTYCRYPSASL